MNWDKFFTCQMRFYLAGSEEGLSLCEELKAELGPWIVSEWRQTRP